MKSKQSTHHSHCYKLPEASTSFQYTEIVQRCCRHGSLTRNLYTNTKFKHWMCAALTTPVLLAYLWAWIISKVQCATANVKLCRTPVSLAVVDSPQIHHGQLQPIPTTTIQKKAGQASTALANYHSLLFMETKRSQSMSWCVTTQADSCSLGTFLLSWYVCRELGIIPPDYLAPHHAESTNVYRSAASSLGESPDLKSAEAIMKA